MEIKNLLELIKKHEPEDFYKIIIKKTRSKEESYKIGKTLARYYYFDYAMILFNNILKTSQQTKDKEGEARAYNGLGIVYLYSGEYDKAIKFFEKSLEISQEIGHREGEARAYNNLGNVYEDLGEYDKAIKFFEKSLEISQEIGHREGEAGAYNNLGNVYRDLGEYDKAIKFFEKSLEISQEIGHREGEARAYYGLGIVYRDLGEYDKAIKFFEKSLEISQEIGHREGEARAYYGLGIVYGLKRYDKAIKFFEKSANLYKKLGKISQYERISHIKKFLTEKTTIEVDSELIDNIIKGRERYNASLSTFFEEPSDTLGNNLYILRRWNSFHSIFPEKYKENYGGGYFLVWNGNGIVIDPGVNFLEIFKKRGFKFPSITHVILTHNHIDHTADLEPIITLLYEYNDLKKKREEKEIKFFMNKTCLKKYISLFIDLDKYDYVKELRPLDQISLDDTFTIHVKPAFHRELGGVEDSIGLVMEFKHDSKKLKVALPSDTKWDKRLIDYYKGADLLIAHINTIKEKEAEKEFDNNHLCYLGTCNLIKEVKPKLAVISEFSMEIPDRINLTNSIEKEVNKSKSTSKPIKCLAGDIGLCIELTKKLRVECKGKTPYAQPHFVDFKKIHQRYDENATNSDIIYECEKHKPK